jgi:hypothetical protein
MESHYNGVTYSLKLAPNGKIYSLTTHVDRTQLITINEFDHNLTESTITTYAYRGQSPLRPNSMVITPSGMLVVVTEGLASKTHHHFKQLA